MTEAPTHYARSGDVHIAYRVFGEGPIDLLYVPTWISNIGVMDEEGSPAKPFFGRLGEFARLIGFDRRGSGMSDPIVGVATLDEQMDDVIAVLDAAGSKQTALFAQLEGGAMATMFAATHPERTTALMLFSAWARLLWAEDYPWAATREERQPRIDALLENWGDGSWVAGFAPSRVNDPDTVRWFARLQRFGASPATARAIIQAIGETDVRGILHSIQVPTLVMRRRDDQFIVPEHAQYLSDNIPGARLVEVPGVDSVAISGDAEPVIAEIEEFLTGARSEREPDRVLATVLFTDIVDSTARAAELGDSRWRELLARHDTLVRRHVERNRGRAVKSTGDGVLATFDGPARAIRGAREIVQSAADLGIRIRAGLHTGECEVIGDDVGGLAVHIGARVMSKAGPSEVMVSSTVRDLVVGSGIDFSDRGEHDLKGVPGPWRLFAVA